MDRRKAGSFNGDYERNLGRGGRVSRRKLPKIRELLQFYREIQFSSFFLAKSSCSSKTTKSTFLPFAIIAVIIKHYFHTNWSLRYFDQLPPPHRVWGSGQSSKHSTNCYDFQWDKVSKGGVLVLTSPSLNKKRASDGITIGKDICE